MTPEDKAKRLQLLEAANKQHVERLEKIVPAGRLLAVAKTQIELGYLAAKEAIATAEEKAATAEEKAVA